MFGRKSYPCPCHPSTHCCKLTLRFHCEFSMLAVPMRPDFFFAASAALEFPALATHFPGFERPPDFVEHGGFCESTFLGFERPTVFTALCVFSGCAGCRGGRPALSGSVSTATWTCISAPSYGWRSQWNSDIQCSLGMHGNGHITHFPLKMQQTCKHCKIWIQLSLAMVCCMRPFKQMSNRMPKFCLERFQGCQASTSTCIVLRVSSHCLINRAYHE